VSDFGPSDPDDPQSWPREVAPMTGGDGERIPNYLTQAILTTVLCCLPFGIVAIVHAAQVNSKVAAGDLAGARESSRKAKTWVWASAATGLAAVIVWFIVAVTLGGESSSNF
jgi:hypothetical protein